ncbi:hypothetical protein Acr_12g0001400 [Actinidia rufa]|uniref:Uncharacterized protein n=1 Tax=Actinidia rufa TaxID=165716 RepID=A0A7J0FHF6_9ERIC|nr:hypothetical protein Acr_12g0001400 [Actinidia rufa]
MRRMLAVMRRNLQNMRKSPRVADETMFGDPNGAINEELPIFVRRSGWNGFSVIQSVVRAPLALLSCVSNLTSLVVMVPGRRASWHGYRR